MTEEPQLFSKSAEPRRERRHPDYTKQFDFGNFKMSMSIWIKQGSAILVVSTFENGKWYVKVKEELKAWRVS